MTELIRRTRAAIDDCEKHLESTESFGTEIESYLTQHLLVIFCAEMQQELYNLIDERANGIEDRGVKQFVSLSGRRVLRSVRKDEIANFLELWGADVKEKFNSILDDKDVTIYNNAVLSRHDIAHKHGVHVSFQEVKDAVGAADNILEAARIAIGVGK